MDTQCGFKCFSADAAEKIFPLQRLNGWAFDVELLYIARKNGFDIQEVPVHWYYDGQSKVNVLKDSFRMFKELLQIRRNGRAGLYKIPQ
jgi:dolichyl-phosphate beta-glucosyltransferase